MFLHCSIIKLEYNEYMGYLIDQHWHNIQYKPEQKHRSGIIEILRIISFLNTVRMQLMEEFGSSLLKSAGKSSQNGIKQLLLIFRSNFQRSIGLQIVATSKGKVYITIKFHIFCLHTPVTKIMSRALLQKIIKLINCFKILSTKKASLCHNIVKYDLLYKKITSVIPYKD